MRFLKLNIASLRQGSAKGKPALVSNFRIMAWCLKHHHHSLWDLTVRSLFLYIRCSIGATKKKWRKILWLKNFGKSYFKKGQTYSNKLLTEIWAVIIFLNLLKIQSQNFPSLFFRGTQYETPYRLQKLPEKTFKKSNFNHLLITMVKLFSIIYQKNVWKYWIYRF